jgi:hypothetical protein
MGASAFFETATGTTLNEAFGKARDAAQQMYGQNPYSGTIATKPDVILIERPASTLDEAMAHAHQLIDNADPRIDNKWESAGALRLHPIDGKPTWLIFGWAPS